MLSRSDHKIFDAFIEEELKVLDQKGLKRSLRTVEGVQGARVRFNGREVINCCSNNYLGLADDARLKAAAIKAINEEGLGAGAARLICGNLTAHQALERKLAQFKETESCLVFSTGYMANVGIIASLFDRADIIFGDKLNHASIIDGILLSRAEYRRYPHNDMSMLENMLKNETGFKKRAIITDSVFSMDGDCAPLEEIVELARRYGCLVMIDEAHAFGVLGKKGKGLAEHYGLEDKIDIQMGTFSKAAGSFGAYVCGSKALIDYLINKARSFIYTTGLPPAVAAVSSEAISIIEHEPDRRRQLWRNTQYLKEGLNKIGFDTGHSQTPIIPVFVRDAKTAVQFSELLLMEGIWAGAIRPPTVPVHTARLRLTVMATHTQNDLDCVLEKFEKSGKELCLI